jgi:hypothetical protein
MIRYAPNWVLFSAAILLAGGCQPSPPPKVATTGNSESVTVSGTSTDPVVVEKPTGAVAESTVVESAVLEYEELFDGESLGAWQSSNYGAEGLVAVVDGEIEVKIGRPIAGIHYTADGLPTSNYRVVVETQKTKGSDFFCCLTFPVDDTFCSLVVGGWGGTVVGLSSINGEDASSNGTNLLRNFDLYRWYQIEVEVTRESVRAFIDGEQVVDQPREGVEFSIRNDVRPSRPLGICAFETSTRIRRIGLLRLSEKADPSGAGK